MTAEFLPSPPEDPVYYKKYEEQEVTERTFPYWKPVFPVKTSSKLLQWQLLEKETVAGMFVSIYLNLSEL